MVDGTFGSLWSYDYNAGFVLYNFHVCPQPVVQNQDYELLDWLLIRTSGAGSLMRKKQG
jgi:hypothetical protein